MKSKNFLFGILALTLVFTMTVVGCNNDPDNGNGENESGGPTFLGKTPTLSGQVYLEKENDDGSLSYPAYTGGDLTVYAYTSESYPNDHQFGQGTIKSGQFSITLGTPTTFEGGLYMITKMWGIEMTASPSNVKASILELSCENQPDYYTGSIVRVNSTWSGTSSNYTSTYEYVFYTYVDKDVTISNNERTETDKGNTYTYKPFSFTLQAGWNTVYVKSQGTFTGGTDNSTITISLNNPGNLKWVLLN